MFGWCSLCKAVALEGVCSKHGSTIPISSVASIDVRPLTELEKELINKGNNDLKLGDGIFLVFGDRMYRRKVVFLEKPILELRLLKDQLHVKPYTKGEISGMDIESLIAVNEKRMERLVSVSRSFAEFELGKNDNALISFSGGKDSVVLSHILKPFKLKNVFVDTGIEFPETYRFIERLKSDALDIEVVRAPHSFFSLLKEKGFPSYNNRWCCKTQKLHPFASYITKQFGNQEVKVFSAERRWEALSRLDQPFKKKHKYIKNQDTVQLLLDWLTIDVWIYIWANKLPVNDLYKYYYRGGCWVCPFGLRYRIFLMKFAHPKLYAFLEKMGATSQRSDVWIAPCSESKPMKHIVFHNIQFMNKVVKLLPKLCSEFEVHKDQKVICLPDEISERKIRELIRLAKQQKRKY
jgi:3'-phosphoadenosine 5'-phosphosulfate sulfotransferase (PAPS reductase)/FAD synthetase